MSNIIGSHGGYRKLRSYQTAELIYDSTVIFCDRFIDRRSRTHDQMVQAARSGKQNIAEGSIASAGGRPTLAGPLKAFPSVSARRGLANELTAERDRA